MSCVTCGSAQPAIPAPIDATLGRWRLYSDSLPCQELFPEARFALLEPGLFTALEQNQELRRLRFAGTPPKFQPQAIER